LPAGQYSASFTVNSASSAVTVNVQVTIADVTSQPSSPPPLRPLPAWGPNRRLRARRYRRTSILVNPFN
jgi:hypothetical protein